MKVSHCRSWRRTKSPGPCHPAWRGGLGPGRTLSWMSPWLPRWDGSLCLEAEQHPTFKPSVARPRPPGACLPGRGSFLQGHPEPFLPSYDGTKRGSATVVRLPPLTGGPQVEPREQAAASPTSAAPSPHALQPPMPVRLIQDREPRKSTAKLPKGEKVPMCMAKRERREERGLPGGGGKD